MKYGTDAWWIWERISDPVNFQIHCIPHVNINKNPTNWWGKAKRRTTQLYDLGLHSLKFIVIIGDLASNRDRIMHLYTGRTSFAQFVQYLNAFCSRHEAASDIISGWFVRLAVPDKCKIL